MANVENQPNNNPPVPTEAEIIDLIKQGKGVANLWSTLRAKYGPAKATYGPFVYSILTRHNKPTNDARNHASNNPSDNNHVDDAQPTQETSTDLEDVPFALSMMDYLRIIMQLNEHRKTLETLAFIVTRRR
jgi:hypothetical protein